MPNFFFTATRADVGNELFVSDGTAAGTRLVQDILIGAGSSTVQGLTAIGNGRVIFSANNGTNGQEAYVSNGTTATLLGDLQVGAGSSAPADFFALSSTRTVFRATVGANNQLFVTDGTAGGTTLVRDFGGFGIGSQGPGGGFAGLNTGTAVFTASSAGIGNELWFTDGTFANTRQVRDINAGAGSSDPSFLTSLGNGQVLFSATDGATGRELYVTDGTTAGTRLVADSVVGAGGLTPTNIFSLGNGQALFSGDSGGNRELWLYNGTTNVLLREINPAGSSNPEHFVALGDGRVLFTATDAGGEELWITNGTTAGTARVADIFPGATSSNPTGITAIGNGRAVFAAQSPTDLREIFIFDGTTATLLRDISVSAGSNPDSITSIGGGRAIFAATSDTNGREVWITDGTPAGTTLLSDIVLGVGASNPTGVRSPFLPADDNNPLRFATDQLGIRDPRDTNGDGVVEQVPDFDVFRFFNTRDGGHFFTLNVGERDQVLATRPDLRPEGVGFDGFTSATLSGTAAVFRFFNTRDGGHFFTQSTTERDQVLATRPDLRFEGIAFYEFTASQGSTTEAVFRFFNRNDGGHFFTSSTVERDQVLATRPDLVFEGVAFHAPTQAADFFI